MSSSAAIISSYIAIIIGIFGLFGNVNLLVAVSRKKKLRSRCGLLMALVAFYDSICIVFMFFQSLVFIFELEYTTRSCFNAIFLFLFVQHMQICTVLSVAVDRLVSIVFPVQYRTMKTTTWIFLTLIVGLIPNAVFLPWAYFTATDSPVDGCYPPNALPVVVARWWSRMLMIVNSAIVIVYISVIVAIQLSSRKFSKSLHDQQAKNFFETQLKAMHTVSYIIIVLCSTIFLTDAICLLCYDFPTLMDYPWFFVVADAASVPIMFQYSLNYYVYFWRRRRVWRGLQRATRCDSAIPERSMFGKQNAVFQEEQREYGKYNSNQLIVSEPMKRGNQL